MDWFLYDNGLCHVRVKHLERKNQRLKNEESKGYCKPDMVQSTKFMFVCQSNTIKRLYQKYAPHLILLDATYKTTKYALPLYFLVVKGNVNYHVCRNEFTVN